MIALAKLNDKVIDVKKIDYTFDAMYQEWYKKHTKGKSESSHKQLASSYKHIAPIKDEKIKNITESMLQEILDNMTQGYSSKNSVRQIMQGVMEYAQAKAVIGENPSTMLDIGKQSKSKKHMAIPIKDLNLIKEKEGSESIIFLTYTGMRINEMLTIEIKNIHLKERYIIGGIKSDAGRDRIIPIHKSQVNFIKKQMKGKKKYLFEYDGEQMSYYRYREIWDFVMGECGFSYTPHDTRHTFVTNMRKAGVDKIVYQRIAGHSGDDVTDKVYTHISKEELIEAIDKLA